MVQTDRIFENREPTTGPFKFDQDVAKVFDDMISRSVPLYADVQRVIPPLMELVDHDPIRIVDLGCSTGTSLIHLARMTEQYNRKIELIGVDNSSAMLKRCDEKLAALELQSRVTIHCCDIEEFEIRDASIVLMNYTLQFLAPQDRPKMLGRIAEGLQTGGFFLMSEKVVHKQADLDPILTEQYFDFKRRNGYSELEIARKRDALENVLVPFSVEQNLQLLNNAGFVRTELILKWFNFATFLNFI